eukprot:TRINITY_DN11201_c0_g1_i1.p1 TRINITY_DN11201_c0_g1~~TRINITY_DN11201_c0_g1_i1.p1  ORF type:complete len:264 (+),score=71.80 TRINITY_DN11201_c0_g1_i1:25-792(+)
MDHQNGNPNTLLSQYNQLSQQYTSPDSYISPQQFAYINPNPVSIPTPPQYAPLSEIQRSFRESRSTRQSLSTFLFNSVCGPISAPSLLNLSNRSSSFQDPTQFNLNSNEIQIISDIIKKSLEKYMTFDDIVTQITTQISIDSSFTLFLLTKLKKENPQFFKAYEIRVQLQNQINEFNYLMTQQRLMRDMSQNPSQSAENPSDNTTNTNTNTNPQPTSEISQIFNVEGGYGAGYGSDSFGYGMMLGVDKGGRRVLE